MPQKAKYELKPLPYSTAETMGNRIARFRKHRCMTQSNLADKIGIDKSLVSDYERDKIRMYDDLIVRFALALGISTDVLLGVKETEIEQPALSLRLVKRLTMIDKLPEGKKKHIIRTLDDIIKANTSED